MRSISVTISASVNTNDPQCIHTHTKRTLYFRYSMVTNISLPTQFTIFNVLLNTM